MRSDLIRKTCSSCKEILQCGGDTCWCSALPQILKVDATQGCLCEKCLHLEIRKEIEKQLINLTIDKIVEIQALGKPEKLIKEIDYNINENGAWVFSSWYLLRQGSCCGNGCKNCPYPPSLKQ